MKHFLAILIFCIPTFAQDVSKVDVPKPATIEITGLPNPGATQVLVLKTEEPGSGDFGVSYFANEGSNGEARHDNQVCFGYNVGGPGSLSTEHSFSQCLESRYATSEGRTQSEFYIHAGLANGAYNSRPFSVDFYHNDGSTQVGIFSKSFIIGEPSTGIPWARFVTTPTSSYATFLGSSRLDFGANTSPYFLTYAGTGLMGKVGNTFKLFTGGITGETLKIFEGSNTAVPLTLNLGTSGIRANNNRWQITGNYAGYSNILTEADKPPPCTAIADSVGLVDDKRAINKALACLRQQGLLAP